MENNSLPSNKPMHVLYVAHNSEVEKGGGASILLYNLMLDMKKRYNVIPYVLAPSAGELSNKCRENNIEIFISEYCLWAMIEQKKTFVEILKYYPRKVREYFRLQKIIESLQRKKFDLIHTNTSVIDIGARIAQSLSIPHIWQLHEYGCDFLKPVSYVRQQFNNTSAIITVSRAVCEYYSSVKKLCPIEKIRVIYGGVKVPEEYNKTHNGRVNFCMIGVIQENKNQLMAINACIKLKNFTDKFMLHIIGTGKEEYLSELKQIINANGLDDNIKFWGFRRDINTILQNMDVGLMLSRREAFPLVNIEYILNYMPVIGVNVGGIPELINNDCGFICELDDSEKLAELMHKFMINPELLPQMGNNARERAASNFSLERNTDEIYKLYKEVLSAKKSLPQ